MATEEEITLQPEVETLEPQTEAEAVGDPVANGDVSHNDLQPDIIDAPEDPEPEAEAEETNKRKLDEDGNDEPSAKRFAVDTEDVVPQEAEDPQEVIDPKEIEDPKEGDDTQGVVDVNDPTEVANAEDGADPVAPGTVDPPPETETSVKQATTSEGGVQTIVIECPKDKVGKLIGKEGVTIRDVQIKSNTKVQIDHKAPGEAKPVTITGLPANVEVAKQLIKEALEAEAVTFGEVSKVIDCPQSFVGRIIGRSGDTIRSLQQASGAHIVVNQDFPDGVPRKVLINGRADAVQRASNMVNELIGGEPVSTQSVIHKHGVGISRVVDCPKHLVGKVIGKGGEVIKSLQKNFGVSIQLDQVSVPCHITVTGPPGAVEAAVAAVHEQIHSGPQMSYQSPRPSFQAPYPAYGQMPPPYGGNPFGAYGAAPAPAAFGYFGSPYGGGYPAAQPMMPSYPAFSSYGAADPYAGSYGSGYGASHTQSHAAPATTHWQELRDNEGRAYYYNSQTGVSQWEKPSEL